MDSIYWHPIGTMFPFVYPLLFIHFCSYFLVHVIQSIKLKNIENEYCQPLVQEDTEGAILYSVYSVAIGGGEIQTHCSSWGNSPGMKVTT